MALLKSAGITAPPRTWDEFAEDCRKVTRTAAGTYGYALDSLDASHVFSLVIYAGRGVRPCRRKGLRPRHAADEGRHALHAGLVQKGYARKIPKRYDDQTEFGSGAVAFTLGSTSGLTFYDRAVKANKNGPFAWTIAPIPQLTATAVAGNRPFRREPERPEEHPGKAACGVAFHQVVLRAAAAGGVDACVQLTSRSARPPSP